MIMKKKKEKMKIEKDTKEERKDDGNEALFKE